MKRLFLPLLFLASFAYAQDIQKGVTFSDGMTVHAADLNNAIDNATVLPTFLSNKGLGTPLTTDYFIFHQSSSSTLKKVSLADFLTAGNALSTTTVRPANSVLAGPISGANAAPTFRIISPHDTAVPTNAIAASTIDCSLARTFTKTLAANTTFTITNLQDGETVTVAVRQAASGGPYTAAFSGVFWKGGVAPTQTTVASKIDLYTFITIAGVGTLGSASQNY